MSNAWKSKECSVLTVRISSRESSSHNTEQELLHANAEVKADFELSKGGLEI